MHYYNEKHDVRDDFNFFECTLDNSCTIQAQAPGLAGYPPGNTFPGGPLAGIRIATNVDLRYVQHNESYAAFGEARLEITDQLAVTGGLRYTEETRDIVSSSITSLIQTGTIPSPFFPGYPSFSGSRTWDNTSGRVVVEYEPVEDVLLYASASTGFRSGNWNGVAFNRLSQIATPVEPETLTSYELGLKAEWFDRRLRSNLSVFQSQYDDLQVSVFANSASILANATSAQIRGAELELTAAPLSGLQTRLALGYLDANYDTFFDTNAAAIDPGNIPFVSCATPGIDPKACGNNLSGFRLVNAPEWTATFSADYERQVSENWNWSVGGDVKYQSHAFFTVYNYDHLGQDAFSLVNFRMAFDNLEHDYRVALWVTNAFDEEYAVDGNQIRAPFGMDLVAYGPPRMFGVTFSGRF